MSFQWEPARSIVLGLLPFAISYLVVQYRRHRQVHPALYPKPRPVPRHVYRSLNVLFVAGCCALLSSLPALHPENVIAATSSRLQTPSAVLWERVAARLRAPDGGGLTELDERLRNRMLTVDGRCLYLAYGPDALGNCPFCSTDDPTSFFWYALPAVLLPHLLNLVALGLATSAPIAHREGSRFRAQAAILGCALAGADVALLFAHDWSANSRVHRPEDLRPYHWQSLVWRGVALAAADAGFALLLYLTSTNRLLALPPTTDERIDALRHRLDVAAGKLAAVGILRNSIARDEGLRRLVAAYWTAEEDLVAAAMRDDPAVLDALRDAQTAGRIDLRQVELEADAYASNLVKVISGMETE